MVATRLVLSTDIGQKGEGMSEDWTATSLGERVEHVCKLRGWSLNKLGEEAGLASGVMSRLATPKRCPECKGTELTITGFAPALVRTGAAKRPSPTPTALFGEPGFHVAHVLCDGCDWVALAEGCPLCGGPGPLRERP